MNRLARDERKAITALVRAVESVKAGKSGAEARYREAADELTRAARSVLERHGKRPTDALLRDVATTLRAAAASEPQLLVSGKLEAAIEPTGFDAMAGATLRAPARRKEPTQRSENDVALEQARAAVEEARTEARRLRRAADDTAREADRAKAAADKADARLKRAEERLARAAAEAASRSDARRAPRR